MAGNAGAFVARNAKAVVSMIGGAVSVLAASIALLQYAPSPVAGLGTGLLAALEVLRTVNVWIVTNEPALEAAADAASELVESITDALGAEDIEIPAAATVA
ncbi:hypothetical protein [Nocardia goodfellowii]|uniref:Membrane protein YkgB n=1 Tax=Nocardia goodfellowii TaxID=882446 RepID=A0ABS4QRH0_9NOCA|nr:hypothetical protein [Nocardia goodfellowii]MBP2194295.1 putative membrane protein YkgB [Nocardia goodfellowii]